MRTIQLFHWTNSFSNPIPTHCTTHVEPASVMVNFAYEKRVKKTKTTLLISLGNELTHGCKQFGDINCRLRVQC